MAQHAQLRPNGSAGAASDISTLDRRIIEHLRQDGRRPFTRIAADLGVSESAVRSRTHRLIERGILQVVGLTDPLKLGFRQSAMIGVRCQADRLMHVARTIAEFGEVSYLVMTAGSYDLLVEVVCEDNDELLRFLTHQLRQVDGVREAETFVYLRVVKQVSARGLR
jgi:Lrp/AsnC family transcriptional regulator for asnA, asnC and gidA